jgi:hypothetical protein
MQISWQQKCQDAMRQIFASSIIRLLMMLVTIGARRKKTESFQIIRRFAYQEHPSQHDNLWILFGSSRYGISAGNSKSQYRDYYIHNCPFKNLREVIVLRGHCVGNILFMS